VFCYYLEIFRACNKHRERVKDFPQPFVDRLFEVIILENSNVGWVERSDTHQLQLAQAMGFAKGSTHPTRRRRGTYAVAVIAKFADYAGAGHLAAPCADPLALKSAYGPLGCPTSLVHCHRNRNRNSVTRALDSLF